MQGLENLKPCAEQIWALSETPRLRLFVSLVEAEGDVSELSARLKLDYAGTSHHLGILRHSGLVGVRRVARRRVHFVNPGVVAPKRRNLPYIDLKVADGVLRIAVEPRQAK